MLGFRVWDTEEKKFVQSTCNKFIMTEKGELGQPDGNGGACYSHPRYIPMQSTGLVDKDGVIIYEGDIIQRYHTEGCDIKIVEDARDFYFWAHKREYSLCKYAGKIIGNKYSNPELLEIK